jgi:catechol 2,3-dioxygenase-like lactoylglutathione lyase family enzyme
VQLKHLALVVHDLSRARRFYERHFGFRQREWQGDIVFLRDADDFSLVLMKGEHPPNPGAFHHFGFCVDSPEAVHAKRQSLADAGVPIIEDVEEPGLVSFKCTDPDGYTVEVSYE